jgi:PP-loop superfamily ATP-utilizing enzyme
VPSAEITFPRMKPISDLERWYAGVGEVLLGYSGGVDSALLAVVGRRTLGPPRFLAAIGISASYPDAQRRGALDLAASFDRLLPTK